MTFYLRVPHTSVPPSKSIIRFNSPYLPASHQADTCFGWSHLEPLAWLLPPRQSEVTRKRNTSNRTFLHEAEPLKRRPTPHSEHALGVKSACKANPLLLSSHCNLLLRIIITPQRPPPAAFNRPWCWSMVHPPRSILHGPSHEQTPSSFLIAHSDSDLVFLRLRLRLHILHAAAPNEARPAG